MNKKFDFKFDKPIEWKTIRPDRYKDFSILDTDEIPCLYAFAVERKDNAGYDVITVFDYGEASSSLITELNSELEKLEKNSGAVDGVNNFIKENTSDFPVQTTTSSMKPLFHKSAKIFDKTTYVSIMEIVTNYGKSYSFQLFVKVGKNMLCFGTTVSELDTKKPFEDIVSRYDFVDDIVNIVVKSIKAE